MLNSSLSRIFALAFLATGARCEERSIMAECKTINRDLNLIQNDNASCDGGFNTLAGTTSGTDKEIVSELKEAKKITSAFVQNSPYALQMGMSALYFGVDTGAFSAGMEKCSEHFFDSGFYKMTCSVEGKHIAVRRNGPPSIGNYVYLIQEVRLYQSTNLLEQPGISISAPDPTDAKWSANNLIQNLNRRTAGDNQQPIKNKMGDRASWESCFKTGESQLTAKGHMLELQIDLKTVHFQHAVLVVQDLPGGSLWSAAANELTDFQNFEIYIGNSAAYAENPKCPGGPFLTRANSNSYSTKGGGNTWKFGLEVWCNMEGRYMFIVADLNHLANRVSGTSGLKGSSGGYEISLCHLAIFGTKYERKSPVPSLIEVFIGILYTLTVEKIQADTTLPIANTLDIRLKQKLGTEISWLTFTEEKLKTKVNFAASASVPIVDVNIVLESYDFAGGVYSALKTDTITVRVLPFPSECKIPLRNSFTTSQRIAIIKEWEPTIYFPENLFSGPHTQTVTSCGGTYTQSITISPSVIGVVLTDKPSGTDKRPSLAIGPSAPVGITFTLTFSGHYQNALASVDVAGSFEQIYELQTVFSTTTLDQPQITHSLKAFDLTFTIPYAGPNATPPTQSLAANFFKVKYPFKAGSEDSLGNRPPIINPAPYTGFTSSQIAKGQASLGTDSLDNPLGSLRADGFSGDLSPGSTLTFACDPLASSNSGQDQIKTLAFTNTVNKEFKASLPVTCVYSCFLDQNDIDDLHTYLAASPLIFTVQSGAPGSKSLSYTDLYDHITKALGFDAKKEHLCGKITFSLVSQDTFLLHDAVQRTVSASGADTSEEGTYEDAALEVTIGTHKLEIPIEVTFYTCTVTSLSFESPVLSLTHKIGPDSKQTLLPKLKQRPDCGQTFDAFRIESIHSEISAEQVLKAVAIDPAAKALSIATSDTGFVGKSVELIIAIDQTTVPNASKLTVTISFTADVPAFDLAGLSVIPLTCTQRDRDWSLKLPSIINTNQVPFQVQLVDSTGTFTLSSDLVTLVPSVLEQLANGLYCPAEASITLQLVVATQSLGSSTQSITVPVQHQPAQGQATQTAGFDGWKVLLDKGETAEKKGNQQVRNEELTIKTVSLSATGDLTLEFSQVILKPNLRQRKSAARRTLGGTTMYDIEDVIGVKLAGEDENGKQIAAFDFIRAENATLYCHLEFVNPKLISEEITAPDVLQISILLPQVFVNARSGMVLNQTSWNQSLQVVQQFTEAQFEELKKQAENASRVGLGVQILQLLLLFFFQKTLFSMWALILTLQFFVYIGVWQVRYPARIRFILSELKRITLGEFLDDYEFGSRIASALNFKSDSKPATEELLGEERLGSGSLFGSIGVTILIISISMLVLVILIAVVVVIMTRNCTKSEKVQARMKQLNRRIFFGPLIRYAYLNSLKLTLASFSVFLKPGQQGSQVFSAVVVFALMNLVPLLFYRVLVKRRDVLTEEETKARYGALYIGKNVKAKDHKAQWFPLAFFLRRTSFILVTVLLFEHPAIQFIVHNVLTMLAVGHMVFREEAFATYDDKVVEVGNEVLLLLACALMLQFTVASHNDATLESVEWGVLVLFGLLLLLNLGYVIVTAVDRWKSKKRLQAWQQRKLAYEEAVKKRESARLGAVVRPPPGKQSGLELISEASESKEAQSSAQDEEEGPEGSERDESFESDWESDPDQSQASSESNLAVQLPSLHDNEEDTVAVKHSQEILREDSRFAEESESVWDSEAQLPSLIDNSARGPAKPTVSHHDQKQRETSAKPDEKTKAFTSSLKSRLQLPFQQEVNQRSRETRAVAHNLQQKSSREVPQVSQLLIEVPKAVPSNSIAPREPTEQERYEQLMLDAAQILEVGRSRMKQRMDQIFGKKAQRKPKFNLSPH